MSTIEIEPTFPSLPERQQTQVNGKPFPLMMDVSESVASLGVSRDDALAWLREKKDWVQDELLAQHGALMFRGFPLKDIEDFKAFIDVFEWEFKERYVGGGGPRITLLGPIKTSTETPASFTIPHHHELCYLTHHPSKLIFFCKTRPDTQGETPLLYSNLLVQKAKEKVPQFVEQLEAKGVRYIRRLSDKQSCDFKYQASWQDIYDTSDRAEAEARARETGTETIEWAEGGTMVVTTKTMDAIEIEPRTGLPIWFNAVCLLHPAAHGKEGKDAPWNVVYGDGSELNGDDVKAVVTEMRGLSVFPVWQEGDVMLVDNYLSMHAREPFTGPRLILAAMIHR